MPKKCCVPGCRSNYASETSSGYVNIFSFPQEEEQKRKWIRSIPRDDWTPSVNSVVCLKHFSESDVSKIEIYKDKNGVVRERPRSRAVLKPNAIPSIFPSLPSYLSKPQPTQRCDPEERRQRFDEYEENRKLGILQNDLIKDFTSLCSDFRDRLNNSICAKFEVINNALFIYTIKFEDMPEVESTVKIDNTLKVFVSVRGCRLSASDLAWVLKPNMIMEKWSQLESILCRYLTNCHIVPLPSVQTVVENVYNYVSSSREIIHSSSCDTTTVQLEFLLEQLELCFKKKKLYSVNTIVRAFLIYDRSRACYSAIRSNSLLVLPHPKHLQKISSKIMASPNDRNENNHFLGTVVKDLIAREKYVVLQIDEIYVKAGISYKCGKLSGMADNDVSQEAKTVVAFMVSSVFGSFKQIVALLPVKNPTGIELHKMTSNVLTLVESCGLTVVTIITDNNRINRNMFNIFTAESSNKYFIEFSDHKIFLTFDSVHNFKNLRNNWLNQKDPEKTLIFPPFIAGEGQPLLTAKFKDVIDLYKEECNSLVKTAPRLNFKTVCPTSIERQNVQLVQNIFTESTLTALKTKKKCI